MARLYHYKGLIIGLYCDIHICSELLTLALSTPVVCLEVTPDCFGATAPVWKETSAEQTVQTG